MTLTVEDIQKAAHLARLEFEPQELQSVQSKLAKVLEMVDQLSRVNTSGVAALAHPLNQTQRLREDRVTEPDQHALAQAIAPAVEADLYLVPAVIEGGE